MKSHKQPDAAIISYTENPRRINTHSSNCYNFSHPIAAFKMKGAHFNNKDLFSNIAFSMINKQTICINWMKNHHIFTLPFHDNNWNPFQQVSHTHHTIKKRRKTGTAYLITYAPRDYNDSGHTTCYTVDPEGGKAISLSVYPSSYYNQHKLSALKFPVACFNSKGPLSDIKFEGRAPDSICKIDNVDFEAMEKQHTDFVESMKTKHTLFSLNYNSWNPLHYGYRVLHMHRNLEQHKAKSFDFGPIHYPWPDDILTATKKPENNPVRFVNCTHSVQKHLEAGGVIIKESNDKFLGFFSTSKWPISLHEGLKNQGEEMINKTKELPLVLQEAVEKGKILSEKVEKAEGQKDKTNYNAW